MGKLSINICKSSPGVFSPSLWSLISEELPQRGLQSLRLDIQKLVMIPRLWHSFLLLIAQNRFERELQLFIPIACTCVFLRQGKSFMIRSIGAGVLLPLDARKGVDDFFPVLYCCGNTECAAWSLGLILGFKHQNRSNDIFGNTVAAYQPLYFNSLEDSQLTPGFQ